MYILSQCLKCIIIGYVETAYLVIPYVPLRAGTMGFIGVSSVLAHTLQIVGAHLKKVE